MLRASTTWLALLAATASCAADEALLAVLGDGCTLNSDCEGGLVCVFARCHLPCATSKDCPAGQRCVAGDRPQHVCQLEDQASCTLHSECPSGQICGLDGRCRDECTTERDCLPGQVCRAASCAEPGELVDGKLPAAPGDPTGKPCSYDSDCSLGAMGLVLECRGGACDFACREERDCGRFESCSFPDGAAVGSCVAIGPAAELYCDPAEEPDDGVDCGCLTATSCKQLCNPDGSGYGPCQ